VAPRKPSQALSADEVQGIYRAECAAAVDWIESNISIPRETADKYYQGQCAVKPIPGRSQITVSVVKDTIRAILPNIARCFVLSSEVVEFSSDDEEDEGICKEMTIFCNGVFNKYGGYLAFIQAVTNALKARVGIIKVDLEQVAVPVHQIMDMQMEAGDQASQPPNAQSTDNPDSPTSSPSPSNPSDGYQTPGIDPSLLEAQTGEAMITEVGPPTQNPDGTQTQQAVATTVSYRNVWYLSCQPPETLIVDINATGIKDARLIGLRQEMAIYEAVDLGLKADDLLNLPAGDDSSLLKNERNERVGFDNVAQDNPSTDPLNKRILITETWNRLDVDGDGVAELRHIVAAGNSYHILVNEPANCVPLALFLIDLQPNVFFPTSLAEDMQQDQDAQTSLLRSIIDNVAYTNAPRTAINEDMVNLEDAKSTEIGSIIRTRGPGNIEELATPFVAGQTLPVLEYLQNQAETRSGVTKLSQGLDPNVLQSSPRVAANAAVQGSDARMEMMARNVGETGMVELFRAILRTAMYQFKGPTSIKVPGGYKKVNPGMWHDQVTITADVGLGNGRIEEKQAVLKDIMATQQGILQQFGLNNPMCSWNNFRNSAKQYLRLSGIKNVTDYFPPVPPDQLNAFQQQLQQQQAAQQQQQGQGGQAPDVVGAAKIKADADMQIAQQKFTLEQQKAIAEIQARMQAEMQQIQAKMQHDLIIKFAELDQKRDAANQQFATDSYKIGMDAQTQSQVAQINAQNQQQMAQFMPQQGGGGQPQRSIPRRNGGTMQ